MSNLQQLFFAPLLLIALAACQGGGTYQTASADYSDVEVNRIGDYKPAYEEFQDRAIRNSLDYLVASGIRQERFQRVVIEPTQNSGGGGSVFGLPHYTDFRLWVAVDGCDSNVFIRTSLNGTLQTVRSVDGCVSA